MASGSLPPVSPAVDDHAKQYTPKDGGHQVDVAVQRVRDSLEHRPQLHMTPLYSHLGTEGMHTNTSKVHLGRRS